MNQIFYSNFLLGQVCISLYPISGEERKRTKGLVCRGCERDGVCNLFVSGISNMHLYLKILCVFSICCFHVVFYF